MIQALPRNPGPTRQAPAAPPGVEDPERPGPDVKTVQQVAMPARLGSGDREPPMIIRVEHLIQPGSGQDYRAGLESFGHPLGSGEHPRIPGPVPASPAGLHGGSETGSCVVRQPLTGERIVPGVLPVPDPGRVFVQVRSPGLVPGCGVQELDRSVPCAAPDLSLIQDRSVVSPRHSLRGGGLDRVRVCPGSGVFVEPGPEAESSCHESRLGVVNPAQPV
jgi:hypothetical protein